MRFLLLLALSASAFAQWRTVPTVPGKPAREPVICSASITTNCVPPVDASGNLKMVATLPTDGIVTTAGTSLTLAAAHNGKILRFTAGTDVTLTVPAGLGAGFMCVIVQRGAGNVIPTASGMTLRQADSLTKTRKLYSQASITCDAADDCVLSGDLQ